LGLASLDPAYGICLAAAIIIGASGGLEPEQPQDGQIRLSYRRRVGRQGVYAHLRRADDFAHAINRAPRRCLPYSLHLQQIADEVIE